MIWGARASLAHALINKAWHVLAVSKAAERKAVEEASRPWMQRANCLGVRVW
jgi:hypothetical protein